MGRLLGSKLHLLPADAPVQAWLETVRLRGVLLLTCERVAWGLLALE